MKKFDDMILVVLESKGITDNKLRGIRKIFSRCNGCKRLTKMVYLVPRIQWSRIIQLVPRAGIILYYSTKFEVIQVEG